MNRLLLPRYSSPGHHGLLVLMLALATLTGACAGSSQPEIAPTNVDADRLLFERGTAALEEEDWLRAREYFVQVRDSYPQSEFRADSRLGVGDTYIGQGTAANYVSATAEFRDFLTLYPTHPRAAYAQFKLGLVNFLQMRDPERDQSYSRGAIDDFEAFIQRYPNSELMPEVRTYLREARDRLSASEVVVGRYYYQNNWWPGAISRLESVLDDDPGYGGRDAVYFFLGASFRGQGNGAEALPMFERLLEEFPESEFVDQVNRVLPELRAEVAVQAEANGDNQDTTAQSDEGAENGTAAAPTR